MPFPVSLDTTALHACMHAMYVLVLLSTESRFLGVCCRRKGKRKIKLARGQARTYKHRLQIRLPPLRSHLAKGSLIYIIKINLHAVRPVPTSTACRYGSHPSEATWPRAASKNEGTQILGPTFEHITTENTAWDQKQ